MIAIFELITPVRFVRIFHARTQLGRDSGRQKRVEMISSMREEGRGENNRIRVRRIQ